MLEQTDKLERFAEVINKTALKQCKSAEKQAADFRTRELKRIKKELKEETERKKSFVLAGLSRDTNREIALYESDMKHALSEKREELTDKVFEEARSRLEEYVLTDRYLSLLEDVIAALLERTGGAGTLCVTARDSEKAAAIAKKLGADVKLDVLDDGEIGGAAALDVSGAVYVSDTLAQRLDSERKRFMSYSGLSISL